MVMVVPFWLAVIGSNTNLTASGHTCLRVALKMGPLRARKGSIFIFAPQKFYVETSNVEL